MSSRIRNIFLDRDGTINEIIFRDNKATSPRSMDEFRLREDFVEFHQMATSRGLDLYIISNQPEIPRGIIDLEFLGRVEREIKSSCKIRDVVYCLHDDADRCKCRKPEPGMILSMLEKHRLEKDETIMVGDTWKDVAAGQAAGVKTALLRTHYRGNVGCQPDLEIDNLMDLWKTALL